MDRAPDEHATALKKSHSTACGFDSDLHRLCGNFIF